MKALNINNNKIIIKVTKAKPEIDSAPPITFMHLHLKLKKLQVLCYL